MVFHFHKIFCHKQIIHKVYLHFDFPFKTVSSILFINCSSVAYILQLSKNHVVFIFFRDDEEKLSWQKYLTFTSKVLITWRVIMD